MSVSSNMMTMKSPSAVFINDLYNELAESLHLVPVPGSDQQPFYTFHIPDNETVSGHLRILDGGTHPHLLKVVQLSLDFGSVGADAHALHIITKADSLVPHCSVEFVHYDANIDSPRNPAQRAGIDKYGSYINLISRVDASVNQRYLHHVYDALNEGVVAIKSHTDIHNATLPLWQAACFQPWIITAMASETHFPLLRDQARKTFDQELALLSNGIPNELVSDYEIKYVAERDRLNRLAINSPDIDPVWQRIARLTGEDDAARLREIMASQVVEAQF